VTCPSERGLCYASCDWFPRICGFDFAWPTAFRAEAMVASVFPFQTAGTRLVGTFYRVECMAGFPMRSAPKASRDHLPVWRDGRRDLHIAHLR
jgi:hypothetical protein